MDTIKVSNSFLKQIAQVSMEKQHIPSGELLKLCPFCNKQTIVNPNIIESKEIDHSFNCAWIEANKLILNS